MQDSTFRYFEIKIAAKKLPGKRVRLDPLAVVFIGGTGSWTEIGRTSTLPNEWNPKWPEGIRLPGDSDEQRRAQIRVDFYNKEMEESRFLGTVECNVYSLLATEGRAVEFELQTPMPTGGSPRVFLTAQPGHVSIGSDPASAEFSLQLMETNYYGVAMKAFYEISRAGTGAWHPVFRSPQVKVGEQGWAQFPTCKLTLRDLCMDEEGTGLLFSLYRFKVLGTKRLLGHFQTSITELSRKREGDILHFTPNPREDIVSADVAVLHSVKNGTLYEFSLKLVNVIWKATLLTEQNTA